jgi:adenine deaminase
MENKRGGLHLTAREMQSLRQVALGVEKADLAVINARLVNVYTGEIQESCGVAVKGRCIALVGPDISGAIGRDTKIIDAMGKTVIPGLIEGHSHLASWTTVHEFLHHTMKGGTTTVITETMEIFPVAGYEGVMDFLESLQDQPITLLATAPAMASISCAAMGVSSCHESTSAQEVLERLRLRLYAMAREGSIRREPKAISRILDHDISLRRLILTTDGIFPGPVCKRHFGQ